MTKEQEVLLKKLEVTINKVAKKHVNKKNICNNFNDIKQTIYLRILQAFKNKPKQLSERYFNKLIKNAARDEEINQQTAFSFKPGTYKTAVEATKLTKKVNLQLVEKILQVSDQQNVFDVNDLIENTDKLGITKMKLMDGFSIREIAKIKQMKETTVRRRIAVSVQKIIRKLSLLSET